MENRETGEAWEALLGRFVYLYCSLGSDDSYIHRADGCGLQRKKAKWYPWFATNDVIFMHQWIRKLGSIKITYNSCCILIQWPKTWINIFCQICLNVRLQHGCSTAVLLCAIVAMPTPPLSLIRYLNRPFEYHNVSWSKSVCLCTLFHGPTFTLLFVALCLQWNNVLAYSTVDGRRLVAVAKPLYVLVVVLFCLVSVVSCSHIKCPRVLCARHFKSWVTLSEVQNILSGCSFDDHNNHWTY